MRSRQYLRRCHAFSLIELLVVVGIISILVGVMLPTLSSARQAAYRTKCMSNLRQLSMAFMMYLNDSDGRFPRPAQNIVITPEDWIYFQSGRDLNQGVIVKYITRPFNADVFRCPTDDIDSHRTFTYGNMAVQYRYSYTVNEAICRIVGPPTRPQSTLRLSQIRNPSEKILLVDEASTTIDDGCWAWAESFGSGLNVMSNRHDRKSEKSNDPKFGRGNAAFVDGHVAFISRLESFDARFYDPRR